MPLSHDELKKRCRALLLEYTPLVESRISNARQDCKGKWDLAACINGRHVEVECKVGSATLSPAQRRWGEKLQEAGAVRVVAHARRSYVEGVAPLRATLQKIRVTPR